MNFKRISELSPESEAFFKLKSRIYKSPQIVPKMEEKNIKKELEVIYLLSFIFII